MTRVNDASGWSDLAAEWSALWGEMPEPVWREVVAAAGIHRGSRVLDVGCGAGEFLAFAGALGADAVGVDPADGMRALGVERGLDIRAADAEHLPFADGTFDVVTAFNALQFADDTFDALDEMARVATPGGCIVIANWAERERNNLDVLERAIDDDLPPDGELRLPGGLESLLSEAGFEVIQHGVTDLPWTVPSDGALVRTVLLGEDESVRDELAPAIISAAQPFASEGGYTLVNAFRWAVGRKR